MELPGQGEVAEARTAPEYGEDADDRIKLGQGENADVRTDPEQVLALAEGDGDRDAKHAFGDGADFANAGSLEHILAAIDGKAVLLLDLGEGEREPKNVLAASFGRTGVKSLKDTAGDNGRETDADMV